MVLSNLILAVTRQGNMSQTQKIDYEVQTSKTLTADDFEGSAAFLLELLFLLLTKLQTFATRIKSDSIKRNRRKF